MQGHRNHVLMCKSQETRFKVYMDFILIYKDTKNEPRIYFVSLH